MNCETKYSWRHSSLDDAISNHRHTDFIAFDGPFHIGRISLDQRSVDVEPRWRWDGGFLPGVTVHMPDFGWSASKSEAVKSVEEYWDTLKAKRAG